MISINNFSKSYGGKQVVHADNIVFEDFRVSFIMGPNGTGKTTTIKCISGLENYDGEIKNDYEKDIFVVWDDTPFYGNLSGLKNLYILGSEKYSKSEIREIAEKEIDLNLLYRKVKSYSYGQKKMLALLLVRFIQPKVLIMDEISNGLDYETMLKTKEMIKMISKETLVILTGHQLSFYNEVVDDVFFIKNKNLTKYSDYKTGQKDLGEIYREEIID